MAEGWQPGEDPSGDDDGVHPVVLSVVLSAVYALLCGSYIVLSGRAAARVAADVTDLAQIELLKGLGFVGATALVFFAVAWLLLHRLAGRQRLVLRQRRALLAADRRALAGLFAAAVAHDVNNVLSVANAHVQQLATELAPERRASALEALRAALASLAALAKRMVALERGHGAELREPVDLVRVARETVQFASRHARVRSCRVTVSAARPVVVRGSGAALGRAALNLLLNAADATGGKGRIELRVLTDGDTARLEVHDDGPGVPPEQRESLFDGFFTTKPDGSGLGLLSVRVTAEEHGGSVAVGESDLGGARFSVLLPAEALGA
jgi:signal transduction histidine kinase